MRTRTNPWMGNLQLENDYNTEILPTRVKVLSPKESGFERQQLLIAGIPQGYRKYQLHSWVMCTLALREKQQWPQKRPDQTFLLILEGLLQREGATGAHGRDKDPGTSRSSEEAQKPPCRKLWEQVVWLRNWKRLYIVGVQAEGPWLRQRAGDVSLI